ncbi:MAG: hypothetical protein PHY95_02555 [Candidatus ainarchaeum sp.]|nr:hypothetical protein [Candidatus ainarchaeum sp.]
MKSILAILAIGFLFLAGCTLPGTQGTGAQGGTTSQPGPSGYTGGLSYPQPEASAPAITASQACEEYATYVKGELDGVYGTYTNACHPGGDMKVYACRGGIVEESILYCGWNCRNNECVHRQQGFCVESSEADDIYRRGETKMTESTSVMERVSDRCASPSLLYEYHCMNGDIERLEISCQCSEGECVRQ